MNTNSPDRATEHDTWAKATTKMIRIGDTMASQDLADRIMRVNKLMTEAEHAVALDDFELFKAVQKKLVAALTEVKVSAESDNV